MQVTEASTGFFLGCDTQGKVYSKGKGGLSVAKADWEHAKVQRGKPRIYIQQYLDLTLPEDEYKQLAKKKGFHKPFSEEAAVEIMESFLEDLDDGSQCDSVHIQRGDGIVMLMTVVSFPYKQETYDRLLAAHMARKALGATDE